MPISNSRQILNRSLSSLLLSLLISVHCIADDSSHGSKPTIGVTTPLTGNVAVWGAEMQRVLAFANKTIANGAYSFVIEDDQCDPKTAVTVAHKLISIDKIKYLLGGSCSGAVLASAPLYEQAKVLFIASGAASPDVSTAGDYIFRTWPSDEHAIALLGNYIGERFHNVGILSEETVYAGGFAKSVAAFLQSKNITVTSESFATGDADLRPVILRLKAAHADVILVSPQSEATAARAVQEIKQQGIAVPIVGNIMFGLKTFQQNSAVDCSDCVYPAVPVPELSADSIIAHFEDQSGKITVSYEFVRAVLQAFISLHQAIQSGNDERDFLYRTKFDFAGLGSWSFDKNGDIVGITHGLLRNGKPL